MCNYLGAELVSVDAAKPRRRGKPALLTTGIAGLAMLVALTGCDGFTVDLGSGATGGKLGGNDTPIVEEITWVDVTDAELIANWQQYVGQEVFVRRTVVTAKIASPFVALAEKIKVELANGDEFFQYLAVTDTVEARGIVAGLDESGMVVIENAHMNVTFSCYPRLHSANIGDPVATGANGLDGTGVGLGNTD
ncbi:hypothetical protein [Dehalogenimonas sp. 4OHTPN]|uniref:Uncharacterized protein n=1 Tax=Dehalogenimonas sp. 4OHTPN TaxID=3166643 RepID=A0AAU8GAV5_9CHLR